VSDITVIERVATGWEEVEKTYTLEELKEIFEGSSSIALSLIIMVEQLESQLAECQKYEDCVKAVQNKATSYVVMPDVGIAIIDKDKLFELEQAEAQLAEEKKEHDFRKRMYLSLERECSAVKAKNKVKQRELDKYYKLSKRCNDLLNEKAKLSKQIFDLQGDIECERNT
jgi:hypothetical protein